MHVWDVFTLWTVWTFLVFLWPKKSALPETNSLPLKIGLPNRKGSYSNHPFLGAMLVSGRVAFDSSCELFCYELS